MQNDAKAKREKLVKLTGKVKTKTGDNLVQMLIDKKCNDLAEAILNMDRGLKVNRRAQEMLKDFEAEPEPETSQTYQTMRAHGAPYSTGFNFFSGGWPV